MHETTLWKESGFPSNGTLGDTTHSFVVVSDIAESTHATSLFWLPYGFGIAKLEVRKVIERSRGRR